jgi:ERCC4-type nuclease
MTKLYVDTREPGWVKKHFQDMAHEHDDLTVEIKKLDTGDFQTDYFIIERKELNDFISSFTSRPEHVDGSVYERLPEQTGKMLKSDEPIKMFLILGEDFNEAYSSVNEHSFNGQLAKLSSLGFNVVMMSKNNDWPDYIYRLCRMCEKYNMPKDQVVFA